MIRPALGIIETTGLTGALKATHAATSAADVAIASAVRTEPGRMAVKIEGDWTAVQKAVEAGARAADAVGELVAMHVIPRTDQDLSQILPYNQFLARFLEGSPRPAPIAKARPSEPKPKRPDRVRTKPPTEAVPAPKAKPVRVDHPAPAPRPVEVVAVEPPAPKPIDVPATEAVPGNLPVMGELEALSVVNLRRWARGVSGLPIQGRQISMANKQQLLEAIRAWRESTGA